MTDLYVLDTSAIFTFTDQEDGSKQVERLLNTAQLQKCRVEACSISLMELYYVTLRERGEDEAARLIGLIKSWPVAWIYPDEKTLLLAGKLKAFYRLSVADALIVAVAKLHNAKLVHKDPELDSLANEVTILRLPFKRKIT